LSEGLLLLESRGTGDNNGLEYWNIEMLEERREAKEYGLGLETQHFTIPLFQRG
jgi:hypothetical protein